jgi:hypothetical protein
MEQNYSAECSMIFLSFWIFTIGYSFYENH